MLKAIGTSLTRETVEGKFFDAYDMPMKTIIREDIFFSKLYCPSNECSTHLLSRKCLIYIIQTWLHIKFGFSYRHRIVASRRPFMNSKQLKIKKAGHDAWAKLWRRHTNPIDHNGNGLPSSDVNVITSPYWTPDAEAFPQPTATSYQGRKHPWKFHLRFVCVWCLEICSLPF